MGWFKRKNERTESKDITKLWQLFEAGKNHDNVRGLKSSVERAYRFYEGDQWYGLAVENADMQPYQNFIGPTIKHKLANVCMNEMAVVFEGEDDKLCTFLTEYICDVMKKIRMDRAHWDVIRAGLVSGNGYLYFPSGGITKQGAHIRSHRMPWQLIDSPNIFFGDEHSADIQSQPYIIIYERRTVDEIRRAAEANGLSEEEIQKIVCDEDTDLVITTDTKDDVKGGIGKCSSIIYMEKREGALWVARSTRQVIYEPLHKICGESELGESAAVAMDMYPLASVTVLPMKGSSRGRGEVTPMIPNQIEYNKNLVRMVTTVKNTAYPKVVYDEDAVDNPDALDEVGAKIAVGSNDGTASVTQMIGYLQPAGMSGDALNINSILMDRTRELMNAGQAVTGEIDPEKASGSAIIAMRDQAAIPLNELQSAFKDFYADCGMILYHYAIAYNPEGIAKDGAFQNDAAEVYSQEQLIDADLSINVEPTSVAPYSIFARDNALEKLFTAQAISFEEFVEALDPNSSLPKKLLQKILEKRKEAQDVAETDAKLRGRASAACRAGGPCDRSGGGACRRRRGERVGADYVGRR